MASASSSLVARGVERDGISNTFRRQGAAAWARTLRIPTTRMYNALAELGLETLNTDDDLRRLVQHLQRSAISFTTLAELFGPETTLFDFTRGDVLP